MAKIGIGIVGGGYMGKAHAVAHAAVGAVFNTELRPELTSVAASSPASAARYAKEFGFRKAADNWEALVADPEVEAVIIASPQAHHRAIAEAVKSPGVPSPICDCSTCTTGSTPQLELLRKTSLA